MTPEQAAEHRQKALGLASITILRLNEVRLHIISLLHYERLDPEELIALDWISEAADAIPVSFVSIRNLM